MNGRNRNLIIIGAVVFLAAWVAWKVLLTKSNIPTSAPVTQGNQQ